MKIVLGWSIGCIVKVKPYTYYTDGTIIYRKGVRSGTFVIDKALTSTGFRGIENTDWTNLNITQ